MATSTLRDLLDLPDVVMMTDFVHQIVGDEGDAQKTKTLQQYQVTPSIELKLDSALSKVRDGLHDRKSVFTWVHGSFGSGKSHFMHVLSLLLADDTLVYVEHPELQAKQVKFKPAAIGRKLFRLHVQCISVQAKTLEEIVFGPAIRELERLHPDAPLPALFQTAKVFASAQTMLDSLGDEKFFAAFPSNQEGTAAKWGKLKSAWDRARFDAAILAPGTAEGRKLAGELARTPWFKDLMSQTEFVRLGEGLAALAEHLKGLGYEGVVLFLDELILWLTTLQEDKSRLSTETAKVAGLIEHGDLPPVLPYFTFAARQRDLSQMVGSFAVGKDEEIFRDYLKYWDSRFETITLEDKDLPRIIEKRVLRPKNDAARATLDQAFADFKSKYQKDFRELFGDQGDVEDFRRVYPFSPALVEGMVALSSTLQRDRTALRELTNLLVRYLPDFEFGNVVPVGDLFDVVVHGQVSDLASIQQVYEQARRVYENDLLPHIRKKNNTDSPERCQIKRDGFDKTLGCAGCAEKACRTQTRIAKTVLLQGIAPNAPALKNLTASRIVALNSGTLKSKVPNQEASIAAGFLREWAALSAAIQVQGDNNPVVRAALDSIDSRRILDANRALDNGTRRRSRIRDMLFKKLAVEEHKGTWRRNLPWSGRNWTVGVVYENVRSATDPVFRPGVDEDVRLVIDFPFDDVGHSPSEDEDRLRQLVEKGGVSTVVWLPAFLGEEVLSTLGDLVILDGLVDLKDDDFGNKVSWVSADDLARAREVLRNQRLLKETQVENALMSAYGITNQFDDKLAAGMRPERNVHLLMPDAQLAIPPEGAFDRAIEGLLGSALRRIAPRHPPFTEAPTKNRLEQVLEALTDVVQSEGQKKKLDPKRLKEVRGIAAVDHMGIVRVIEDEVVFAGGILNEMGKRLAAKGTGTLSVEDVRVAIDPEKLMSLSEELVDFLVLAYAVSAPTPFRFTFHGSPTEPVIGKINAAVALVPVKLPTAQEWERALMHAGIFGISLGKALSASRLDDFAKLTHDKAAALLKAGLDDLQPQLLWWAQLLGIADMEKTQRGEVVATLLAVARDLPGKGAYETARVFAELPWKKERTTALAHMAGGEVVQNLVAVLKKESNRELASTGMQLASSSADALAVLDSLRASFSHDENVDKLATAIDVAMTKLIKLHKPVVVVAAPPQVPPGPAAPGSSAAPGAGWVTPSVSRFEASDSPGVRMAEPSSAPGPGSFAMSLAMASDLVELQERLAKLIASGAAVDVQVTVLKAGRE
jgi:hypothetical protein